jgi:hypothetical protein
MAYKHHRPSLLGGLLWLGVGIFFLLRNFGVGPDFWFLFRRYWPVLLIILGIAKVLEYFLKKDSIALRFGEIFGILFLLLIGSFLTMIFQNRFGQMVREWPIHIGGQAMRPGQWIGETHTFSEESVYPVQQTLPILVENSYGAVTVVPGSSREIRVRLKKVVYANEPRAKKIAGEIRLDAKPEKMDLSGAAEKPEAEPGKSSDGEVFAIRTNREALSSREYIFNTDLEIIAPKDSRVQVRNSVGEVRVAEMNGGLDLSTSHRTLEVRDCAGQFKISAKNAESNLTNLVGNLDLDARGKVYIDGVKGNVRVTDEYAGLEISNVDGNVEASSTEGSIRIEKVSKPVIINSRGTEVRVDNLQSSLKISASHKDVDISNVSSDVSLESRYATISLKNIKGSVDIRSNSDSVIADEITGSFKLKAYGSEATVNGITGPLDIQTTLKDVTVNDYADSCTISNEYADINVASRKLGKGDVSLKNSNGDIELMIPENAAFVLDANARNGSVESSYSGLDAVRSGDGGVLKSKAKTGGPKISAETKNGTINIRPIESAEGAQSARQADPVEANEQTFHRSENPGYTGVAP